MPRTKNSPKRPLSTDAVRREAAKLYARSIPLPEAIRRLDVRAGRPTIGLVSPVYWRLAGEADPIEGKTERARNAALKRRRESGVRFEILAASLAVSLGRKVSTAEVKNRLAKAGLDLAASYTGRGTRVAAPKTLETPAASAARVAVEQ